MPETRYVGIDAGGSTTICLIGDGSSTLARGTAGPANPSLVGVDGFRAAISASMEAAARDLPPARIGAAWLGVAGSEQPTLRARLRAVAVEALGADRAEISHDARLLLAAADVEQGIGLVAGTGSSAYGRGEDGREVSVGGWGHLLGDEGSGYDIAVRALRAVTAAADGRGPRTSLERILADRLGVDDPRDLRERMYPAPAVTEIASLAEAVLGAADGDAVAAAIVDGAARDLATLVDACAARLFDRPNAGSVPVVLAGGLLASGSALHWRLVRRLDESRLRYQPITPTREPAAGGLALARAGPREPPIGADQRFQDHRT
jgi:N-acetylglucosamine kinase-like BadF-type ATPase